MAIVLARWLERNWFCFVRFARLEALLLSLIAGTSLVVVPFDLGGSFFCV